MEKDSLLILKYAELAIKKLLNKSDDDKKREMDNIKNFLTMSHRKIIEAALKLIIKK